MGFGVGGSRSGSVLEYRVPRTQHEAFILPGDAQLRKAGKREKVSAKLYAASTVRWATATPIQMIAFGLAGSYDASRPQH